MTSVSGPESIIGAGVVDADLFGREGGDLDQRGRPRHVSSPTS
jgi:hypothetical protein